MKKFRQLRDRSRARMKKLFESDGAATSSSAPISPKNPGETASLTAQRASSSLPPEPSRTPVSSIMSASTRGTPIEPTIDQIPLHVPSIQANILASGLRSESTHQQGELLFVAMEQSPVLTDLAASSQTINPNAAIVTQPATGESPPVHEITPVATESGMRSWTQWEAWANLKGFLDTLNQAASINRLGPVKNVVEEFASCIGIYEEAAQSRKEYNELRMQLEYTFEELKQYFSASPIITTSIRSICGSIQKELEYIKARRAKTIGRRFAGAEMDADDVLKCYQRMQDHLQRLSRNANISIWVVVDQLATDHRLQKLAPSLWACYNSEKATELKRGPCTEGTRTSVLLKMREWATNHNTEGVYWINGMAGTGKTTIAYSLCKQLDTEESRLLCASFFCSRSFPECRSVGRIVPSIAYQIARCSQPFRYALSKATEEDPDAHTRSVHLQFESLIMQPLSDTKVRGAFPKQMVVVIDALDECEDVKSTQQMLEVLLSKSKDLPIKFIVSSRPEASIRHQMKKNGTSMNSRVVLHELDDGEVQTDIRKYLETGLAPISPTEDTIKRLAERAGVLFIYAATVIRYVGYDDFGRNPHARLEDVLGVDDQQGNSRTKVIDQLYEAILEAAIGDKNLNKRERDEMKLVLNTVVCAQAPLTVDILNVLLELGGIERVNAALHPLWSVLHVKGSNMLVTTLHASFPDYLTDPERSGGSMWHCDPAIHHHVLAERCFGCIRDARPQFNICQLESSYLNDSEVKDLDVRVENYIPAELRYACRYWSAHLYTSNSLAAPALVALLEQFLVNSLLLWLEVMNLGQDVYTIPGELITVSRWAMRHGATPEVINLLRDAWRFATTLVSSPVTQSTPHIYISMLPFLPSHSPIRKHYSKRIHGMIGVEGTAHDQRKGLLGGWSFGRSNCAACSPDCTMVVFAPEGLEGLISLVDLSSGRLVCDLSPKDIGKISRLTFSPDGTHVASGASDGAIWVWDVCSGQLVLGPLTGHTNSISSLVYSHSGSYIISGSDDHTIRLWDAKSGKPEKEPFLGHTRGITSIAISPDDSKIISGSKDMTICVWDMQRGYLLLDPFIGHTDAVTSIAISPDGKLVVTGSYDHTVYVWDIQAGHAVIGPFSLTSRVCSVAISPDNTYIPVGLFDGTVQIWDINSGKAVSGQLRAHWLEASMLAYSPDGTRIISYSNDGSVCLFDAQSITITLDTLPGDLEPILSIDISPDGKHIVSGSDHNALRVWDRMSGELVHGPLTGHTEGVHYVRYSADGSRILSCSSDSTLRQWDARNGGPIVVNSPIIDPLVPRDYQVRMFQCATYSPDGTYIATSSYYSDICVWCSSSGKIVLGPILAPMATIIEPTGSSINFSADGMDLIHGYGDGTVQIWNAKTGQLISSIQPRSDFSVSAFAFSVDWLHNVVARDSYNNPTMHRRITHTGEPTHGSFNEHTEYISSIQFSPDSTCIVSGSWDKAVHVWDAQSGTSIFGPLIGHTDMINSVAYSPDGTYIASASRDTTIRIWDVSTQPDSYQAIRWTLQKDGWVVDRQCQRLIWVPPELHDFLILPRNTMLLSCTGYVRLKFDDALLGEAWINCWTDIGL